MHGLIIPGRGARVAHLRDGYLGNPVPARILTFRIRDSTGVETTAEAGTLPTPFGSNVAGAGVDGGQAFPRAVSDRAKRLPGRTGG